MMRTRGLGAALAIALAPFLLSCASGGGGAGTKGGDDPFAKYVWPPPPDKPRIRLTQILSGRADVEATSGFGRALLGAGPQNPFDRLKKPFAVEFDTKGRILVSDPALAAVLRFDRQGRRLDVLGTTGSLKLKTPLGLCVGPDGTVYVADSGLRRVVAYEETGDLKAAYGKTGELTNPADAALSPDGKRLYVADSKAHRIAVFDVSSTALVSTIGTRGEREGEFNFPSALAVDRSDTLYVVDQINARVQLLTLDGEFIDAIGGRGVSYGQFVRPKDVALDEVGLVYVTDGAFSNVQIFGPDLELLTFVGGGGLGPGAFQIASGVAVRGQEFAVVDQLGARVQLFKFLVPKGEQ